MVPDCPICSAVAGGGRIRIDEDEADLLDELLAEKRHKQLVLRRIAIEDGDAGEASIASLVVRQVDRLREEIARTRAEKGWTREPERPDPS